MRSAVVQILVIDVARTEARFLHFGRNGTTAMVEWMSLSGYGSYRRSGFGGTRRNCPELTGRWERKCLTDIRALEGLHAGYVGSVASVLQVAGPCNYGCADDCVGDWGEYGDLYAGTRDSDEVAAGR